MNQIWQGRKGKFCPLHFISSFPRCSRLNLYYPVGHYQINSNCRQDDRIIRLVKFGKSGEKSRREILVVQGSLGRKYVTMGRRKQWKSISTCNGTRVHALAVIERTISSTTDLQYNSWHRRWPIHLSSMRLHANQRFEIVLGVPLPGHE